MSNAKIALIIPYFGKFPDWMDLYLYSCSKNPFIDFHYYTDCKLPEKIYPNTIFHTISFKEYLSKVNETLDIKLGGNNPHPYKLCDLKPFYGYIHSDISQNYEWWGFGDIDVIYGDLSNLLNENNLKKYDLITTHIKCIAGHFTIIKSVSSITNKCFKIKDWRRLLESSEFQWLDEVSFSETIRPIKVKVIDKLWYHLGKYLKFNRTAFYKFWSMIIPGRTTFLMVEPYTTFKPIPNKEYIFNINSRTFYLPGSLDIKNIIPKDYDLPYLHLLYFKKVFYYDTEHYWKKDFYKIPILTKWDNVKQIIITTSSIKAKS